MGALPKLRACSTLVFLCAQLLPAQKPPRRVEPPEVQQHIDKVTTCLRPRPWSTTILIRAPPRADERATYSERKYCGLPQRCYVGTRIRREASRRGAGHPDTLFQAGSISKLVAAMAALYQVQNKRLALDADINTELVSWKVPNSPAANGKVVTLRELLTHTAGFTVHGFPGYAANEPVPTLIQVLDGQKPANTPAIRLQSEPGSTWNYSGGGYTVMHPVVPRPSFPPR